MILCTWLAGSKNDFIKQFRENEQLYNQAKDFWKDLEGSLLWIFPIVIAVVAVLIYYTWFNNSPGRHYHPKYWGLFLVGMTVFVWIGSFGLEYYLHGSALTGATKVLSLIATEYSIYAVGVYLLLSVIWCNWLPTNAYRLFKFTKS